MGADGLENTPGVGAGTPVLAPGHTYATITDKISSIVLLQKTRRGWWFGFAVAFTFFMILNMAIGALLVIGVGLWGINIPIAWGFAIVNFVWWIGIGHAGTLISAFLLLMRQAWRQSINRFAEAMTLFAVWLAPACSPCSTWGGRGCSTGCCLTQIPWESGRSSAVRWCGMCLPSQHTPPYRYCSGSWD